MLDACRKSIQSSHIQHWQSPCFVLQGEELKPCVLFSDKVTRQCNDRCLGTKINIWVQNLFYWFPCLADRIRCQINRIDALHQWIWLIVSYEASSTCLTPLSFILTVVYGMLSVKKGKRQIILCFVCFGFYVFWKCSKNQSNVKGNGWAYGRQGHFWHITKYQWLSCLTNSRLGPKISRLRPDRNRSEWIITYFSMEQDRSWVSQFFL